MKLLELPIFLIPHDMRLLDVTAFWSATDMCIDAYHNEDNAMDVGDQIEARVDKCYSN